MGWSLALAVRADAEQQEEQEELVGEQEQKVDTAAASWLAAAEAELEAAVMLVGPAGLMSVEAEEGAVWRVDEGSTGASGCSCGGWLKGREPGSGCTCWRCRGGWLYCRG